MAMMVAVFGAGVLLGPAIFAVLAGVYDYLADRFGMEVDEDD